ncbi:MaoC family dehydratase [Paeniglutamicibacter sulfureus]|uniref:Acyl dehydratase n=1 Tax=Paeniglutamicibacter sulfureus TaxID=43666 RepID=A0ABU2BJ92_9MICC|nr:MaoC family dehydratase [Paeniglutamicibacter sulfureus]MDO2934530.1 MaoC family dehydratase [Paeniglutamicibacter sulfureus]MDR7358718.1 acyl dehydratase [Paeniglutamicibacter sulfureus]
MGQTVLSYEQLATAAGTDLGYSDFRTVTQDQVNTFADATDDHQWIHTDPEKAKDGPFGGPIAHGYLSLSLQIAFWSELFDVTGVSTRVNYGLDKVRFPSPVPVGAQIRMKAQISEVEEVKGGYQIAVDQVVEVEGAPKPAVVSRGIYRFYA